MSDQHDFVAGRPMRAPDKRSGLLNALAVALVLAVLAALTVGRPAWRLIMGPAKPSRVQAEAERWRQARLLVRELSGAIRRRDKAETERIRQEVEDLYDSDEGRREFNELVRSLQELEDQFEREDRRLLFDRTAKRWGPIF